MSAPPIAGGAAGPAARYDTVAIKRANPLEHVARAHGLRLRPCGQGRFVAFCPFHDDRRTPNLRLDLRDPDDEHFHCFAGHCRAHGDVIGLVMLLEGLDFRAACARLAGPGDAGAGRPDAPSRRGGRGDVSPGRRWDRLTIEEQTVMNLAGATYRRVLRQQPDALRYLRGRGLPDWLLERCALGWADGGALAATLDRRDPALLPLAADLGLLRRAPDGGWRDALSGRVVIPEVRDGHFVWFIGRGLAPDGATGRAPAKYLALPGERPALGRRWASGAAEAFICEGVFDWLAALARRLPACCPCGTHLPVAALGFLARARRIYGVFDGDAAGRAASGRFGAALGERYRDLPLPDGTDLADLLLRPDGRAHFAALLDAARRAP